MIIYQIVSVRDLKAEIYGQPVFSPTLGSAVRSFQQEVNRVAENNLMNQFPADFQLFHLGSFNDSTGEFSPVTEVVRDFVKQDDGSVREVQTVHVMKPRLLLEGSAAAQK